MTNSFSLSLYSKECLSTELWDNVVSEVFVHNSYYCHPENLLFCVLMSDFSPPEQKQLSCDKLLAIRKLERKRKSKKVRRHKNPTRIELNLDARNPLDLVKWDKLSRTKKTSSPLLNHILDNEIPELVKGNPIVKKKVAKLLCHSQLNEQMVQMVAKSVKKVKSHSSQRAKIISTKKSQENIPLLCTKKEFKIKRQLFK